MSERFKQGYKWASDYHGRGHTLEEIEDYADNSFDFDDFDRGALAAVRDIQGGHR